ncbi:uncharacterized protein LOC112088107 [Eutrema salsugineum]|uniref:uncharacterized protein LOC112088107 n=1 Tax=Eutrema salsugineum TaxID=72664 RepID=UPI000CED1F9E|nr:uncharacterized protein LOC112088107 [Eutrema salsugineum]
MDKCQSEDNKFRVRHLMVVKPVEKMYPVFESEPHGPDVDKKVHKMICDILGESLDEESGDDKVQTPKQKKRKMETARVEMKKKEKLKVDEGTDSVEKSKKMKKEKERMTTIEEKDEAMEKEGVKIDNLYDACRWRIQSISKIGIGSGSVTRSRSGSGSCGNYSICRIQSISKSGIGSGSVTRSRSRSGSCGKGSDTQSWMLEMQETSEPGFHFAGVVRTPMSKGKTAPKVKKEPADPKEKKQPGIKSKTDLKQENLEKQIINLSDVSRPLLSKRALKIPTLQDKNDSAVEAMTKRLSKLVDCAKMTPTEKDKRGRSLTFSQVSPYLGNSVVRCIMVGAAPPPGRYDSFEVVDAVILDNLLHCIAYEAENHLDTAYAVAKFYLTLMTPKKAWQTKEYRWLHDLHICKEFDMFWQRSMRHPSPYKGRRVAFIDHTFCRFWCGDYWNKFLPNEKGWIFSEGDCGVYTIKTIECLALCHKWDPLKDSNMPSNCMKYAVEIYDEVHVAEESRISDPNPRGAVNDKYGLLIDSAN